MTEHQCDIAIIGGGPAGSTAAYVLAQKGWKVTLFEKDKHPRFHIGESMLPMVLPIFEQLGVSEQIKSIGIYKSGAEFYAAKGMSEPQRFYFRDALDKDHPFAYQIRRDQMDELLLRNCERAGAQVLEEMRVRKVDLSDTQDAKLRIKTKSGDLQHWQARHVIDASGRDTLLANKLGFKRKNLRHGSAALYGHFRGVQRHPGEDAGLISIAWFDHGWIWMIPLPDGIMSMGAVCDPAYLKSRQTSPEEFLLQTLQRASPQVRERIQNAELINAVSATGNYSYQCDEMCLPGAVLIGDAYSFVDPVFSSGVLLGMRSALRGAAYVDALLRNAPEAQALKDNFEHITRKSIKEFSWTINRFNSPAMKHMFMHPANPLRVKEAVISLLAGDIDRNNEVLMRLRWFKLFFYWYCLTNPVSTIREWLTRRRRAQVVFTGGNTEVDTA